MLHNRMISMLQLLLLLLILKNEIPQTTGVNLSQLKGQHQQSMQQQQQQPLQNVHQQTVSQQQQQQQQQHQPPHMQQAQYVHEKDPMQEVMKNVNPEEDITDPYQILNELKHETRLPPTHFPWNPYSLSLPQQQTLSQIPSNPHLPFDSFSPIMPTPKFLPFFGYPQPVFIPYPLYIAPPEMFYPAFAPNGGVSSDIEESMSRAANGARRPSSSSSYQRNSPIYYVRLPPTPYMFLPGYTAQSSAAGSSFGTGFSSVLPYQSLPTFSTINSIFNLPVNFLANGKPTNIYQMGGSPNDIQNPLQFGGMNNDFGSRPPPPYRPNGGSSAGGNYLASSYGFSAPPPQQDSKMTSMKRPFIFNGRPEEIYILPNNFNPLYSDSRYY